jgi:hypothetical protein
MVVYARMRQGDKQLSKQRPGRKYGFGENESTREAGECSCNMGTTSSWRYVILANTANEVPLDDVVHPQSILTLLNSDQCEVASVQPEFLDC